MSGLVHLAYGATSGGIHPTRRSRCNRFVEVWTDLPERVTCEECLAAAVRAALRGVSASTAQG